MLILSQLIIFHIYKKKLHSYLQKLTLSWLTQHSRLLLRNIITSTEVPDIQKILFIYYFYYSKLFSYRRERDISRHIQIFIYAQMQVCVCFQNGISFNQKWRSEDSIHSVLFKGKCVWCCFPNITFSSVVNYKHNQLFPFFLQRVLYSQCII